MTQCLKPAPWPCFNYQYRSLLRCFCRVEEVSETHRLEPGTGAFSGVLLTSSSGSSRQGGGARVRVEGSGGVWMEREEWFVSGWEGSASRTGGRRTLGLFPAVSVLAWLCCRCLYQWEELGTLRLAECCVETHQLLCLYD